MLNLALCIQNTQSITINRVRNSNTNANANNLQSTDSMGEVILLQPIPLRLYTLPHWSNPPFLICYIRALWRSGLSARAPECQKLNKMMS